MLHQVAGSLRHGVSTVSDEHLVVSDSVQRLGQLGTILIGHVQAVLANQRANIKTDIGNHAVQQVLSGRLTNIHGARHRIELIDRAASGKNRDFFGVLNGDAHGFPHLFGSTYTNQKLPGQPGRIRPTTRNQHGGKTPHTRVKTQKPADPRKAGGDGSASAPCGARTHDLRIKSP